MIFWRPRLQGEGRRVFLPFIAPSESPHPTTHGSTGTPRISCCRPGPVRTHRLPDRRFSAPSRGLRRWWACVACCRLPRRCRWCARCSCGGVNLGRPSAPSGLHCVAGVLRSRILLLAQLAFRCDLRGRHAGLGGAVAVDHVEHRLRHEHRALLAGGDRGIGRHPGRDDGLLVNVGPNLAREPENEMPHLAYARCVNDAVFSAGLSRRIPRKRMAGAYKDGWRGHL